MDFFFYLIFVPVFLGIQIMFTKYIAYLCVSMHKVHWDVILVL